MSFWSFVVDYQQKLYEEYIYNDLETLKQILYE